MVLNMSFFGSFFGLTLIFIYLQCSLSIVEKKSIIACNNATLRFVEITENCTPIIAGQFLDEVNGDSVYSWKILNKSCFSVSVDDTMKILRTKSILLTGNQCLHRHEVKISNQEMELEKKIKAVLGKPYYECEVPEASTEVVLHFHCWAKKNCSVEDADGGVYSCFNLEYIKLLGPSYPLRKRPIKVAKSTRSEVSANATTLSSPRTFFGIHKTRNGVYKIMFVATILAAVVVMIGCCCLCVMCLKNISIN